MDGDSDRTKLHWAASDGNFNIAKQLIADGAEIDATDEVHVCQRVITSVEYLPLVY